MATTFSLLCQRCGLSNREAADYLSVRLDTAKSWSAGRNPAPVGAIGELRQLYARIERAAAGAVVEIDCQTIKHGAPDSVELGLSSDDHEAQSIGWPCVGAHAAVLGLVAARVDVPLAIVPRGSTIATAGASDAND